MNNLIAQSIHKLANEVDTLERRFMQMRASETLTANETRVMVELATKMLAMVKHAGNFDGK